MPGAEDARVKGLQRMLDIRTAERNHYREMMHAERRKVRALQERIDKLVNRYVPIVAALAIYGEAVNLDSLIERARALNEAKL